MLIVSPAEYAALKREIRNEVLQELTAKKSETFGSIARESYRREFDKSFPTSEFTDLNRRCKIQNAVCAATNVLRMRQRSNDRYIDRNISIRSEAELQSAIETHERVCAAFREIYQADVIEN